MDASCNWVFTYLQYICSAQCITLLGLLHWILLVQDTRKWGTECLDRKGTLILIFIFVYWLIDFIIFLFDTKVSWDMGSWNKKSFTILMWYLLIFFLSSGFSAQFCFQKDCFKAKVCIYRRLEESWYTYRHMYPVNSFIWVQLGECWSAEREVAGTNPGQTNP